MKDHAHIKAEINGGNFVADVQGDGESLSLILAEVMNQLHERGYDNVVRAAMSRFFENLPD